MSRRLERTILSGIVLLFAGASVVGITWGLPSRKIDRYLFGDAEPWSGEKIYRLAGAGRKFSPNRGADVDADPLKKAGDEPVLLTGTDKDVAKIYLRYRLYTYQPDEMITMMALAGMRPLDLKLDPQLYQYGGLFIYPVGALIGACGLLGLIDVRNDEVYYLDHPDEFGKFYVVARGYAAAWGAIGVVIVFAIARRMGGGKRRSDGATERRRGEGAGYERGAQRTGSTTTAATPRLRSGLRSGDAVGHPADGSRAGLLAGLLFTLMPVVVCMAHEGKPHLPGAVLMLTAVLFAMRHLDRRAAGPSPHGDSGPSPSAEAEPPAQHAPQSCIEPSARWPDPRIKSAPPRRPKRPARWDWWLMCGCCGAAFGMVLSSWPIFVLIPLVAWLGKRRSDGATERRREENAGSVVGMTALGTSVGVAVYLITNPYIVINAVANREVLRSNFGNSLAMYEISRIGEGFVRVVELTIEGATLPVVVVGTLALVVGLVRVVGGRKRRSDGATGSGDCRLPNVDCRLEDDTGTEPGAQATGQGPAAPTRRLRSGLGSGVALDHAAIVYLPLIVPAAAFFLQFVLIGAGKPAEYERFGVFPNTALAIGAACVLTRRWTRLREIVNWVPATFVVLWTATFGNAYLAGFTRDQTYAYRSVVRPSLDVTPEAHAFWVSLFGTDRASTITVAVTSEPAPYCLPALDFSRARLLLFADFEGAREFWRRNRSGTLAIRPVDNPVDGAANTGAVGRPARTTGDLNATTPQTPTERDIARLITEQFRRMSPNDVQTRTRTTAYPSATTLRTPTRRDIWRARWATWVAGLRRTAVLFAPPGRPTPISWASKPFEALYPDTLALPAPTVRTTP